MDRSKGMQLDTVTGNIQLNKIDFSPMTVMITYLEIFQFL